jgi:hypothetical protein
MRYKLLQSETACGVGTGNGSNFGSSTAVRVVNSGTSNRLMSVETSANVLIGTFTLGGGKTEVIQKSPTDEVFSASAEVLGVGVAING